MNDEIIWNYLIEKIKNPYGVAALMGNLFAESSLNPINSTGAKKLGLTNEQYTQIADARKNNNFINDGVAYGLVQWCYHTRKQGLYELAGEKNKSVGDIYIQLEYMWSELQKYKTVLNAIYDAKDIRSASDVILLKYEKPANKSDTVKEKRAAYGKKYYDKFANSSIKVSLTKDNITEIFNALESTMK